jgi:Rrf2 family protein
MPGVIKFSEAASIAMHTTLVMAEGPDAYWSAQELAERLNVSLAHLAKVMQSLRKSGLVTALRGPKGGSRLSRAPESITLLEVYEAIEGPMIISECLLDSTVCMGNQCTIGKEIRRMNKKIKTILQESTLVSSHIPGIDIGLSSE